MVGLAPNWFIATILSQNIEGIEDVKVAIETGTFEGDATRFFAEVFDKVYTVEALKENNHYTQYTSTNKSPYIIHNEIKEVYTNIEFHYGNSPQFLDKILPKIKERCLILLDAHLHESTPLMDELVSIKNNLQCENSIILIDDGNYLGCSSGWPSFKDVEIILHEINPLFKIVRTSFGNGIIICYE